jgi:hypothetical protein
VTAPGVEYPYVESFCASATSCSPSSELVSIFLVRRHDLRLPKPVVSEPALEETALEEAA